MNHKIYALIVLTCIGLLLGCSTGQVQTMVVLSSSGTILAASSGSYTFEIKPVSGEYNVIQGGSIVYQNSNAANAINWAITHLTTSGQTVMLDGGTYTLTTSVVCNTINGGTLEGRDGATLFIGNGAYVPAIYVNNVNNWLIYNVTINGNVANNPNVGGWAGPPGLSVSDWGINLIGNNDEVLNCTISNCRVYGIAIYGSNSGAINNTITYVGWNGINLWGASGCYAIGNEVAHCSDVGISNWGSTGSVLIENNYVHDIDGTTGYNSAHFGIAFESYGYSIIEGNTVVNCLYGIDMTPPGSGGGATPSSDLIAYNTVTGCTTGINDADAGYDVITQNTISNWGQSSSNGCGIMIYQISGTIATFNTLKSTSSSSGLGYGIWFNGASNCSVCNNVITTVLASGCTGIELMSNNYNLIEGNNVQAHTGVAISGTGNRVYGNTLTNCTTQISNGGSGTITSFASPAELFFDNPSNYGTISPSQGDYLKVTSNQVSITLTPNSNYYAYLNVDGANVTLTGNSYTLSMSQDHNVYAMFSARAING